MARTRNVREAVGGSELVLEVMEEVEEVVKRRAREISRQSRPREEMVRAMMDGLGPVPVPVPGNGVNGLRDLDIGLRDSGSWRWKLKWGG